MIKVRAIIWIIEKDLPVLGPLVTEFREREEKPKRRNWKGTVGIRGARTRSKGVVFQS